MPKTLLALLALLTPVASASALPPEGPSGRLVLDPVPELKVEVARREREVADAGSESEKQSAQAQVAEARARLAEAEGRTGAAASEWRKVIAYHEARMAEWLQSRHCDPSLTMLRGPIAAARCSLAEVERKPAVLAKELPKVIAYYEERQELCRSLVAKRAIDPDEAAEAEKLMEKELRKARLRLEAVRKKLAPQGS